MDEHRQNAYRFLLYQAMLEIRPIAWHGRTWNPLRIRYKRRMVAYAGALADVFHNLAFFAARDFEGFVESRFWDDLESLDRRFPDRQIKRYQAIFDEAVDGNAGPRFPKQ